jgi:hypothetical protein
MPWRRTHTTKSFLKHSVIRKKRNVWLQSVLIIRLVRNASLSLWSCHALGHEAYYGFMSSLERHFQISLSLGLYVIICFAILLFFSLPVCVSGLFHIRSVDIHSLYTRDKRQMSPRVHKLHEVLCCCHPHNQGRLSPKNYYCTMTINIPKTIISFVVYFSTRASIQKFPYWVITKYMLTTINTRWEATQRVFIFFKKALAVLRGLLVYPNGLLDLHIETFW